jgi:hypothetical protein
LIALQPRPGARQTEEIKPRAQTEKRAACDENRFKHKRKSQIWDQHKTRCKLEFFIQIQTKFTSEITDVTALPPSFDYWNGNELLTHLYSRKYGMKLGSGKEPHLL